MRMAVLFLALVNGALFAGDAAPALPGADGFTVKASGLRLVAPAQHNPALRPPFDATPGATVALVLHAPNGGLVKLDKLGSALSVFADDKGQDLTRRPANVKEGEQAGVVGLHLHAEVTPDGKFCALEAYAPALPGAGATQIKLEGTLSVLVGSKKDEKTFKDIPLRDGSKFTLGEMELTLDDAGKPDDSLEPFGLTVRCFGAMDAIAALRFFKADGTELLARRSGTSTTAALGSLTEKWFYRFAERADVATIKVSTWSDLQKVKVPFKLQVGLGVE